MYKKTIVLGKVSLYVILLYLFAFKNLILDYFKPFKYYDECLALAGLLLIFFMVIRKQAVWGKENKLVLAGLVLFACAGLLGNVFQHYQADNGAILADMFTSIKFWLWMYLGYYLCGGKEVKVLNRLDVHVKILTIFFMILTISDMVFHIFNEKSDIKMGLRAVGLFEGPAGLTSVAATFLFIHVVNVKKRTLDKYMIMQLFLMCVTLRFKSLAAIPVFLLLLFYTQVFRGGVKIWYLCVLAAAAVAVAWQQIYNYLFVYGSQAARTQLYVVAFKIMKDFFPFGTGFGTYASYYSGVNYSGVYHLYGLDKVHGLSRNYHAFISDTFWPMVMGQTGLIGSVGFVMALLWLFRKITKCRAYSSMMYIGMLYIFLFLLLTSFAESSFLHWNSHMIAIVMGVIIRLIVKTEEKT